MRQLLIILALLIPAASAAGQARVVFTAGVRGDSIFLQPLLLVTRTNGRTTWGAFDSSRTRDPFTPGITYGLQLSLRPMPALRVAGSVAEMVGCDEALTTFGIAERPRAVPLEGDGLAGDVVGLKRPSTGLRRPTTEEDALLRKGITSALVRLGLPAASADSVQVLTSAVDALSGGARVLAATWILPHPERWLDSAPSSLESYATGMMIMEQGRSGWRIVADSVERRNEVELRQREIIGVADLDGDGMPEILVENNYYESWDHDVLARRGGKWVVVWSGGGGGC